MSNHLHHIRGDTVAGTGFGYECLWRALLLLRLTENDVIKIYVGEDATIEKHDGSRTCFQIKYTKRHWTIPGLREFLTRLDAAINSDTNLTYVFCTNGHLDRKLEEEFAKYRRRLIVEVWEPNVEDPLDKIRSQIRTALESKFQGRNIGHVLRMDHIDRCCDRLLAIEAQFKFTGSRQISFAEVWEQSGLNDLVSEIPGLVFGQQLLSWSGLIGTASERIAASDSSEEALQAVLNGRSIEREIEVRIRNDVLTWLSGPRYSAVSIVHGPSGAGKTWLLLRLGMHLAQIASVFWLDDLRVGMEPTLSAVSDWEGKPCIILIDNFVEAECKGQILEGIRSRIPICVIATTSKPFHHPEITYLQKRTACRLFPLPTKLGSVELEVLIRNLRFEGTKSIREDNILWKSNIRYAVRFISKKPTQAHRVASLFRLWREEFTQAWIFPLVICSSMSVWLPQSILRKRARFNNRALVELPDEIVALLTKYDVSNDELFMLEGPDVAAETLDLIRDELEENEFESLFLDEGIQLLTHLNPRNSVHRRFARRFISEFYDAYQDHARALVDGCSDTIRQFLPFESSRALAYTWLRILPHLQGQRAAQAAARALLIKQEPQSSADIAILVAACGYDTTKATILKCLRGAPKWDIQLWARFVDSLKVLDQANQREPVRISVSLWRASSFDVSRLLKVGNVAVNLISLIADVGTASDREWLCQKVDQLLPVSPALDDLRFEHVIPTYLELVSRVLMQSRNSASIKLSQLLFARGQMDVGQVCGLAHDLYKHVYLQEMERDYVTSALERSSSYASAETSLTKAHELWPAIFAFAQKWAGEAQVEVVESSVYKMLAKVRETRLPVELFQSSVLAAANHAKECPNLTEEKLNILWDSIARATDIAAASKILLLISTALARKSKDETPFGLKVKDIICNIATSKSNGKISIKSLAETVGSGLEVSELPPAVPLELDLADTGTAAQYVYCLRQIPWSEPERSMVGKSLSRFSSESVVRTQLFLTYLFLGCADESRELVDAFLADGRPDCQYFASSWEAKFGDAMRARAHLESAVEQYRQKRLGGHPPNISRAFRDLAMKSEGAEREILNILAALSRTNPLERLDEVISKSATLVE